MGLQGDAGRLSAAVTVKHSLGDKSDSDVVVAEKCAWAGLDAATASFGQTMRPPAVLLATEALLRAEMTEMEATTNAADAANSVR